MTRIRLMLTACLLLACAEPDTDDNADGRPEPARAAEVEVADRDEPEGPPDAALAARGEALFTSKACLGCHTIGKGRLTGPDLAGVTERRSRTWMLAMITNPDSMLKNDATARQLFMEYATPMVNMNVSRDEARALYEYLRTAATPD